MPVVCAKGPDLVWAVCEQCMHVNPSIFLAVLASLFRSVAAEKQRTGASRWGQDILDSNPVPSYSMLDVEFGCNGEII